MPSSLHSRHYQIFRSLLIDAREASGLTQLQIAEKLGKQQSFVSKYERGERRLDFTEFVAIAELLSVDFVTFLDAYRSALETTRMSAKRK